MSEKEQKDIKPEDPTKLTFTRQKRIDESPIVPVNQPIVKVKTETVVEIKTETKAEQK